MGVLLGVFVAVGVLVIVGVFVAVGVLVGVPQDTIETSTLLVEAIPS